MALDLKRTGGLELDATDLNLLHQLQVDASLTNEALAGAVHISPPTCLRRVKRLRVHRRAPVDIVDTGPR